MESSRAERRPGGRTAETGRRIFDAALSLLVDGGLAACTFQAVAERAGVARATLYRRWPDRASLVADALAERLGNAIAVPDTGSLAGDLLALLSGLAAFLESPLGRAAIIAAAESGAEAGSARSNLWSHRLAAVGPLLDRAVARGEIDAGADREALLACAVGALYFRTLIQAAPLDEDWLERIVEQTIRESK